MTSSSHTDSSSPLNPRRRAVYHSHVLRRLPKFASAFAYGASILTPNIPSQMLDYIIVVDDARAWHEANMRLNPSHYSRVLRFFGASAVDAVSNTIGVGVHFNAYVDIETPNLEAFKQTRYKYGIVERRTIERDVEGWDNLFLAGRMQKPYERVMGVREEEEDDDDNDDDNGLALDALNGKKNKRAALAYALLVSRGSGKSKGTTTVEERDLYETIANLSYDGDIRHVFGAEDAQKARRIVDGSFEKMREWYEESFRDFRDSLDVIDYDVDLDSNSLSSSSSSSSPSQKPRVLTHDHSPQATRKLLAMLPPPFLETMVAGDLRKLDMVSREANAEIIARSIRETSRDIVRKSSLRQSISAALTTDVVKVVTYAYQKFSKYRIV